MQYAPRRQASRDTGTRPPAPASRPGGPKGAQVAVGDVAWTATPMKRRGEVHRVPPRMPRPSGGGGIGALPACVWARGGDLGVKALTGLDDPVGGGGM